MKTMTSISGGKTSAYLAANYPTDYNIFALVTTSDKSCIYPDKKLRQVVSDKIGKEFIGTLEDDIIIHTILDLEQFMGRKIDWVAGETFEESIKNKSNFLPNIMIRYCTTNLKMQPIFEWWKKNINKPVSMNIGYRVTEKRRADNMIEKCNKNGFNEFKNIEWRKPNFPLIDDFIERQDINKYWKNKPVRFAELNNCVGCFHRSASLLNKMSKIHESKFDWFIEQEKKTGNYFKKEISYKKIKESNFTMSLPFNYDSEGCESGFCGI